MPPVFLPLGFAFVPDAIACQAIVELHRDLHERHPSDFVLHTGPKQLPHISLFQGRFSAEDIPKLAAGMQETVRRLSVGPIEASAKPPQVWAENIVFLDVTVKADLSSWQREIMQFAEPLRRKEGGPADTQALRGLSDNEKTSYKKYQYPFVGDALRPHFTMGRIENDSHVWPQTHQWLVQRHIASTIQIPRFVLFEVGPFGALSQIFAEISLNRRE